MNDDQQGEHAMLVLCAGPGAHRYQLGVDNSVWHFQCSWGRVSCRRTCATLMHKVMLFKPAF